MRKTLILLILFLSALALNAVDFLPGSGEQVISTPTREYSFGYNTGTDDYHWYGSDQWAVRYNFKAQYPSLSLAQFSLTGASIYFPVTGHPVTVELFTDNNGQPQQRVGQVITTVDQNQMYFDFGTAIQTEVIWLIVTYNTGYNGPYVAASMGGGTHSYYLNTNVSVPYFQTMASAGFDCEFLINVVGDFLLSSNDLELANIELGGSIAPGATVAPKFTIYNHSQYAVTNASIALTVTSPASAGFTHQATIPVNTTIQPQSQFILDTGVVPYTAYQFSLERDPMQLKMRAVLSSEFADTDTLFNNTKIKYFNAFNAPMPILMAENFLRNYEIESINALQDTPEGADLHRLNYFPVLSDSLSNIGAVSRFSWYSLFSTPVSILNGDERLCGLTDDFGSDFNTLAPLVAQQKSFISTGSCSLTFPTEGENLSIRLMLSNSSTHLFNTTAESNLVTSGRLFVAFFKRSDFTGNQLYVFNRWIAFGDTISTGFSAGQNVVKDYSTSLSNIAIDDLAQNYRLYYWFQLPGGQVLYANFQDLATAMDAVDETLSPFLLSVYPNPSQGSPVMIRVDGKGSLTGLKLYNVRGQLIWQSDSSATELRTISPKAFPGNGIYLLKASYRDERGVARHQTTKITFIK